MDPLLREDLRRIIEAASWAPSASNRQDWEFVAFPYSSIRIDYQKIANAQKIPTPVILVMLSKGAEDIRFYWNIAGIAARFKPTRAHDKQWGVHYDISTDEFGSEWGYFWKLLLQQWAA